MNNILNIPNLNLINGVFFYLGIKVEFLTVNQESKIVTINLVHIENISKAIEIARKLHQKSLFGLSVSHYPKTENDEEKYIITATPQLSDDLYVRVKIQGKDNGSIYDLEYAKKIGDSLTIEA